MWVEGCLEDGVGVPAVRERERLHVHRQKFKNNYFAEMCSGSEAGSYLRLIDLHVDGPKHAVDRLHQSVGQLGGECRGGGAAVRQVGGRAEDLCEFW